MAAPISGAKRITIAALASLAVAVMRCELRASTDPVPKDKTSPKIVAKIAFAGDSIVDNEWEGILPVMSNHPCLKTSAELGRFARNGTGLTRGDKLCWPREVRRIGETFKPAWRLKPDGADNFASYGPDRKGRTVQIRSTDGEHFTVAGKDLIAAYLFPEIVVALKQMGTSCDRACAGSEQSADGAADKAIDKGQQP